jgi:hypothetical protein
VLLAGFFFFLNQLTNSSKNQFAQGRVQVKEAVSLWTRCYGPLIVAIKPESYPKVVRGKASEVDFIKTEDKAIRRTPKRHSAAIHDPWRAPQVPCAHKHGHRHHGRETLVHMNSKTHKQRIQGQVHPTQQRASSSSVFFSQLQVSPTAFSGSERAPVVLREEMSEVRMEESPRRTGAQEAICAGHAARS